jgi:hypothetical protein
MYSEVNRILCNASVTYLEFGVWTGDSLRAWTRINTNPDSHFYGFDSFEGLPKDWAHPFGRTMKEGEFSLGGVLPSFQDSRVTLIKGWFQQTLREFLRNMQLSHPFVVHIDSDLHSSALYVLCTLDPILQAGDVIMFDEYSSCLNEYLAWEEYKRAFLRRAECLAMGEQWSKAAFVLV